MKLVYTLAAAVVAASATVAVAGQMLGNQPLDIKAADSNALSSKVVSLTKPGKELDLKKNVRANAPVKRETTQEGNLTVTTENGVIVDVTGVDTKYYNRAASGTTYFKQNGSLYYARQEGIVEVVEDGNNVYIKNPLMRFTMNSWIKGTKSDNVISFATGQPLSYNSTWGASICLEWASTGSFAVDRTKTDDIQFSVDGNTLTLLGTSSPLSSDSGYMIGAFWNDDDLAQGYWDTQTVLELNDSYTPPTTNLVELPAGVETEEWYMNANETTIVKNRKVEVAMSGNDIYIKGISSDFSDSWVKGTIEGNTVSFENFQYVGDYSSYNCWMIGVDADEKIAAPTATYNSEAKTISFNVSLLVNAAPDRIYYLEWYDNVAISAEAKVYPMPTLPYTNGFDTAADQADVIIIDANNDGSTFSYVSNSSAEDDAGYSARYKYSAVNNADDYLIMPGMALEAGKTYVVSVESHYQGFDERFEVVAGKDVSVSELTIPVIEPTDVTNYNYETFSNSAFSVVEDGVYYFAVHAISDADAFYLYIDNFSVKEAAVLESPVVNTIAELKALEPNENEEVNLVSDDLKVTFANEMATFIEDATGAITVYGNDGSLVMGKKLSGHLTGCFTGESFELNPAASQFTASTCDLSRGAELTNEEMLEADNAFRLVTVVSTEEYPIVKDEGFGMTNGNNVYFVDMFDALDWDFEMPEAANSVTGILLPASDIQMMEEGDDEPAAKIMIAVRSAEDFELPEKVYEVSSIAELKALPSEGETLNVVLNTAALTVTFVDETYTFVQDESGAIMAWFASEENTLSEGDQLSGTLKGSFVSYWSMSMFMINDEESTYTRNSVDVSEGAKLPLEDLSKPENEYVLVTVEADPETPWTFDEDYGAWKIAENLYVADVFDALGWNYDYPVEWESVTGLINFIDMTPMSADDESEIITVIAPRRAEDVKGTYEPKKPLTLAEIKALDWDDYQEVELAPVKVTFEIPETDEEYGVAVLEDETGAMYVYTSSWYVGEAPAFHAGTSVSGTLLAYYYGDDMMIAYMDYCELNEEEADVTTGTEFTEAEILSGEHNFCLATINSTDDSKITVDEYGYAMYGNRIMIFDVFDLLGEDYEFPESIESATGIIMPLDIFQEGSLAEEGEDEDAQVAVFIALRSIDDIKAGSGSAISNAQLSEMLDGPIYDLNGAKVSESIKDMKNLAKGIYIVNGKKLFVR